MNYKFSIYQLKESARDKMFLDLDFLARKNAKPDINDYEEVFSGTIEGDSDISTLEDLFYIFNLDHPKGYDGHSLSVSDVVKLNDDALWYCDSFGWKKIA